MKDKIHHTLYTLISAGAFLLLNSCIGNTVYHSSQSLPHRELNKRDTLCFAIDSLPSYSNLKLEVELRTVEAYPYQKLSLTVDQKWENGKSQKDVVTLHIDWEKKVPSIFLSPSVSIPINIKDATGKGTIKVYHHMKREHLPGISDLGIHIVHD